MWFILDRSLLEIDTSNTLIRSGLEPLLYSAANGTHAISCDTELIKHLLKCEISPRPKSVLTSILSRSAEIRAQARDSTYRILVKNDPSKKINKTNHGEWSIPIQWLAENDVPRCSVIGENLRDTSLFEKTASHYKIASKINISTSIHQINGGGAETPNVYEEQIRTKASFSFCITDSDRRCPAANHKSTSAKCLEVSTRLSSTWVADNHILPVREIENFIPKNIIEDTIDELGDSSSKERLEKINSIVKKNPIAWGFLDLKDGTTLRSIRGACHDFWSPLKNHSLSIGLCSKQCIDEGNCKNTHSACHCLIAPSINSKITEHAISWMNKRSAHEVTNRAKTSENWANWLKLGHIVCSWGAAFQKVRS